MNRKRRILFSGEYSQLSTGFSTYMGYILPLLYKTGKYEIAEHASYLGPQHPLLDQVPWLVYPNEPDQNDKKAWNSYMSNKTNVFGKWKFEEVLVDFKPDIVCFPGETLVYSKRGYLPIAEIQIGDEVLTHRNRFKKVTQTFKRSYKGKMRRIDVNGIYQPIECTPEHPLFVYKHRNQTNQKKSFDKIYKDVNAEFISAQDVNVKDLCVLPKLPSSDEYQAIDIDEYYTVNNSTKNKISDNQLVITEDIGRLLGYIVGDGVIQQAGVYITFEPYQEEYAKDTERLLLELGLECHIQQTSCGHHQVRCYSKQLSTLMNKISGSNSRFKHIPYEIMCSPESVKFEFLNGLIRTDGHCTNKAVGFGTVSKRLAYEYRLLCTSIGIPCSLLKNEIKPKKDNGLNIQTDYITTFYECVSYGQAAIDLNNEIDKPGFIQHICETKRRCRQTHIINNQMIASIKNNDDYDYNGDVFNIEVEDDNSYVIEWCVHNCELRDPWMMQHIINSPFRDYYKFIYMPTCDGTPQKQEWLDDVRKADCVLTYSLWAKNVLEKESKGDIQVTSVASPGTDLAVFHPMDKKLIKEKYGVPANSIIFGSVMRNQPRKLFPEIMRAFVKYMEMCQDNGDIEGARNSFLYFHTTLPDVGWALNEEIKRHKLDHKILFTYMCDQCQHVGARFFSGELCHCPNCGGHSMRLPNTAIGVTRPQLAEIMNCFDLYIQHSIAAGWEMPINDSKACGVPVAATYYSAMQEQCHNGGAAPINVKQFVQEPVNQTNQLRAWADNDHLAQIMYYFAHMSPEESKAVSLEARQCVEKYYSWDRIADIWDKILAHIPLEGNLNWNNPLSIVRPNMNIPPNLNNQDFIEWCYKYIIQKPMDKNREEARKYISYLNIGYESFFDEYGRPIKNPVDRNTVLQRMVGEINHRNQLEQYRYMKTNNVGKPELEFQVV